MNAAKPSAAFGGDVEPLEVVNGAAAGSQSSSHHPSSASASKASTSHALSSPGGKNAYAARPARQQITQSKLDAIRLANDKASQSGLTYNIWYNKYSGGDREDTMSNKIKSETRVDIARDSGWTRADTKGGSAGGGFVCLFFARGYCPLGNKCDFHHRLPLLQALPEQGRDIFGREKHGDYRDDMGGVGSLERVNRTLYIGRIVEENDHFSRGTAQSGAANGTNWRDVGKAGPRVSRDEREKKREKERKLGISGTEMVLRRHFGEFGEIQRVKVLHTRSCAFVTYVSEASAQFAKEAMSNQSLDHNEVLNVRWATDDPNPGAQKRDHRERQVQGSEKMWEKMSEEQREALRGLGRLEGVALDGEVYEQGETGGEGEGVKRARIEEAPSDAQTTDTLTQEEYERLVAENEAGWASMGGEPAHDFASKDASAAQHAAAALGPTQATQTQPPPVQNRFIDISTLGDLKGLLRGAHAHPNGANSLKEASANKAPSSSAKTSALGGLTNYASDSGEEEES